MVYIQVFDCDKLLGIDTVRKVMISIFNNVIMLVVSINNL